MKKTLRLILALFLFITVFSTNAFATGMETKVSKKQQEQATSKTNASTTPEDTTELNTAGNGNGEQRMQLVEHLMRGLLEDVLVRPFSGVHRIGALVGDGVEDTLRLTDLSEFEGKPVPPISNIPPMNLTKWEQKLDEITDRKSSSTGTLRYLVGGKEFFPRLIHMMAMAEKSIDMRTYIFDNDDYAIKVADILRMRSKDAKVRVLMDGLGTIMATMTDPAETPAGAKSATSITAHLKKNSEVKVRQATNPWFAGDHVKTTIIDNQLAFVGGMNIGREYRYEWHDLMMEVTGPVVSVIQHEFDKNWAHAGRYGDFEKFFQWLRPAKKTTSDSGHPLRVLFTKPGVSEIYDTQIEAIKSARSYIYIENAYFSDDAILYELIKARRRGVDVRVIIPEKGNHDVMNISNILAANAMLRNGIRVFVYPGMSHVKAAVYDGWACMGSANFDRMSFRVNKELNLATSDKGAVAGLMEKVFLPDFEKSTELTETLPEKWHDFLSEFLADQL